MAESIRARTDRVVATAVEREGRPLLLPEIVDAYTAAFGPVESKNVASALVTLQKRGRVRKAGGAHRRTLYAHVDSDVESTRDHEPILTAVLEVVDELTTRSGFAVPASRVHERLAERGIDLSTDQVRTRLETLARDSSRKRSRAHDRWAVPQIRKVVTESRGGRRSLFWAPIGTDFKAPLKIDRAEGLRLAVEYAENGVGRPVTKDEVEHWAHSVSSGNAVVRAAARAVLGNGFRSRLSAVATQDESGSGPLRVVPTPFTSRGAYPSRYTVSEDSTNACALAEDLADLVRPAVELYGIEHLRWLAKDLASDVLHDVATVRESVLRAVLVDHVPDELGWVVERCIASHEPLLQWIWDGPLPPHRRDREADRLADQEQNLVAMEDYLSRSESRPRSPYASLLDVAPAPLSAFEDLAVEVFDLNGLSAVHWRAVLAEVRRIRGPVAGGVSSEGAHEEQTWLDRSDALIGLVDQCSLPSLGTFVALADTVVGGLLRDRPYLEGLLGGDRPVGPVERQAFVTSLALQGHLVDTEVAWPDPRDPDGAELFLAAVALAVDDPDERCRLADAADARAEGAARSVTDLAQVRFELGGRLSVID